MCKKRKPVKPSNPKKKPTLDDIYKTLVRLEASQTQGRFVTVLSIAGAALVSVGFAMWGTTHSNQSVSENQRFGWITLATAGLFCVIQAIALLGQPEYYKIESPRELFRIEYAFLFAAFVLAILACVLIDL